MEFVGVGMNAASVGDEFGMLTKGVTSESLFAISEKSSYNKQETNQKKKNKQATRRKERK